MAHYRVCVHEKNTCLLKKNNPNCGSGGSGFGRRHKRTTATSQKIIFLYHEKKCVQKPL